MSLFDEILKARGLTNSVREAFLNPDYEAKHDPFLLPDMKQAVDRLVQARQQQEPITIYGDYDIDGLTATTVLLDALEQFGFVKVDAFIPNRFVEGYGLTVDAIERIAATGAKLVITVDCGSLSEKEIVRANELGMDVIVTDHHNVAPVQPPAVAVINPKRLLADYPDEYEDYVLKKGSKMHGKIYPFLDLPGVGVAFKLVQALQAKLPGLEPGQEKWLLDLVALGTVCDVVNLTDENRMHVYWGLKVLAKTRRQGLKALMAVAKITPDKVVARSLGFGLGPRMNAAGRLETAQYSLDLLRSQDSLAAYTLAEKLDVMNTTRRSEQDKIFAAAKLQAERYSDDNVLVLSGENWSHGIIGIVAAKILETYKKPTFILEEMGAQREHPMRASGGGGEASDSLRSETEGLAPPESIAKGSARSFGDFSAADAIRAADDIITKGGGHRYAAGVTLPAMRIADFRQRVNEYYRTQKLFNQEKLLLPQADVEAKLADASEELVSHLAMLEPFGNGNPEPVLKTVGLMVTHQRRMGSDGGHVKLDLQDDDRRVMQFIAFNAPAHFFVEPGQVVTVWYQPTINEWNSTRTVEGRLLHLETD